MRYLSFVLLLTIVSFLTSCGEVAEGMTSDDAVTGAGILAEGMREGMEREAAGNLEPDMTPVPASFNVATISSYATPEMLSTLDPCFMDAKATDAADTGNKKARYYDYVRHGAVNYRCAHESGLPVGGFADIAIVFNGKGSPGLEDYELEYYTRTDVPGTDGVYYHDKGGIPVGVKGFYQVKLTAMIDGKTKPDDIGRDKINTVMAAILAKLP